MAKIFFEFSKGIGPLIRCVPIAEQLRAQGHEIYYFAHEEAHKFMDALGFRRISLEAKEKRYTSIERRNDWVNADEYWGGYGFSDIDFLKSELKDWIGEIRKFNPDVIVSDLGVFSSLVSRIVGIPLVTITQSCYHVRAQSSPQRYWKQDGKICIESLRAINSVLAGYNAAKLDKFEDLFVGNVTLIPSFPEFDVLRETKNNDNTYYIGPILWEGIVGEGSGLIEEKTRSEYVFCYIGQCLDEISEKNDVILESINNIAHEFNVQFILSINNSDIAEYINAKYEDRYIHITKWMPIKEAYTNSKFIICHGGHGSCMGVFQYKVPALIIPTHTEREYNARLVENVGVGISIPYNEITGSRMEQAMRSLLQDLNYSARAQYYNQVINNRYKDGEILAAEHILSLCSA